jgi:Rrf2 family nitric oxide-sensitive transcriptional repressor
MKLTAFTDYSLRVLIYLAAEPARRATIHEIARAFDVSEHHLTKVVHFLGKQAWVGTVRGNGGGLALAAPAQTLCVGEVVRRTEGHALPAECFRDDGGSCVISRGCQLRGALGEAVDAFYAVLDQYTLADLVRNRATLIRTLNIGLPARAS